ncbi:MAG: hypothetical protein LUD46_03215 [Parabacteroides sp.]|nr:hypothetical protein [Parabacteroides sp.]
MTIKKNVIKQFASNNNMIVDRWYHDTRATISRNQNNRLEDIILRMKAGDTLIIADVTRLSRN